VRQHRRAVKNDGRRMFLQHRAHGGPVAQIEQ
jgi:hypothetical protein